MIKKYELKFYFEFGAGGCLWASNKLALETFDSPADAVIKDLEGKVIYNPLEKLPLSKETLSEIEKLDAQYFKYLNQDDPSETIIFDKETFLVQAKNLFNKIKKDLEKDFEIIWAFDIN
jgi:hypothetical protein